MKKIVVVIRARQTERQREALRAAVGLGLRGDAVSVVLGATPDVDDPLIRRALGTLRQLGREMGNAASLAPALADADVVEVWT